MVRGEGAFTYLDRDSWISGRYTLRSPPAVIVKVCAFDVPPICAGAATLTGTLPPAATSAALIVATNCDWSTNVVGLGEPFH